MPGVDLNLSLHVGPRRTYFCNANGVTAWAAMIVKVMLQTRESGTQVSSFSPDFRTDSRLLSGSMWVV